MNAINKILMAAVVAIPMIMLSGCSDDRYEGVQTGDGDLAISFVADDLVPGELKTRAGAATRVAKDNEELEIKSLHVFLFGSDGEYLQPSDQHRYQGYTYLADGISMLRIDKEGFLRPDLASNATVCVVANVERGTFTTTGEHPDEIGNLTDFRNFYYQPENYQGMLFNLPEEGMPMVAIKEGVDLAGSQGTIDVELTALMARIDVNLSVSSDASSTEYPSILLKSVTMNNMAQGAGFTAPDGETPGVIALKSSEPEQPGGTSIIYNRQAGRSLSFYVFENVRDDNGKLDTEVYPQDENFKEEYKQRYKPLFAQQDKATYARFDCLFTSYNGLTYNVTYDLYFGANSIKDFKIRRNSIYTNDVTIKGLVNVGDTNDKVIFDARVNVEPQENAYFISALRERQLDAHFCVFPMDVYVMETGCHVNIEILDAQTTNWIRMEKIPNDNMANGTVPDYLQGIAKAAGTAYTAGNGKRDFFTTDLVTNSLANNTFCEMNHRDRVYFYVDEFLSTQEAPRVAQIRISLVDAAGEVRESHDVEFDQYGLQEVTVRSGSWNEGYPGNGTTIYMERFEEYLNFSDPLEEYASDFVYTGLPWGANGSGINGTVSVQNPNFPWNRSTIDCYDNYYHGLEFTQYIVASVSDIPSLNRRPDTAAGYCWNKNKRSDTNGNINDPHWFLPGIRQLESCLVQYYNDYPEFRTSYYWSSAAAKYQYLLITREETTRARATKIIGFDGSGNPDYAESGSLNNTDNYTDEDGTGGRALRTQSLRIRACYTGPVNQ